MICPRCNRVATAGAKFCRHCGASLALSEHALPTTTKPVRDRGLAHRYRSLWIALIALAIVFPSGYLLIQTFFADKGSLKVPIPEKSGVYVVASGQPVAVERSGKPAPSDMFQEVRITTESYLSGTTELRQVLLVPRAFQIIWREDELRGSSSYQALADWMLLTTQEASLRRLSYIKLLFERRQGHDDYQTEEVAAWASGDQIGYGELAHPVRLAAAIVSVKPAIVAARAEKPLDPGLYRLDWRYHSLKSFVWVSPAFWKKPGGCVNIWRGDPDFGKPLLKACDAGRTLSAAEASMLDVGRSIRRYLDENFPGWSVAADGDPACDEGSPWTPHNVWGDFNGDGMTDYAVKIYHDSVEYLLWWVSDGSKHTPVIVERLALQPGRRPSRYHPYLTVEKAGTPYYDHEKELGGRYPNDAVVRNFCEQGAIAYFLEMGAVRKVWVRD